MALNRADVEAISGLASRLKVDPASLGGLMELESNIDPNIWGGAGGKYRGLIQFGPGARQEVGLPSGRMTISEQIPYVEKYFQQRGFKPGKHGVTEMYRTVLVGNPHQSGTDSFNTNSDSAARRMMPGGDLYKRASTKLQAGFGGPLPTAPNPGNSSGTATASAASSSPSAAPAAAAAGGGGDDGSGAVLAALAASSNSNADVLAALAAGGNRNPASGLAALAVSQQQGLQAMIDDLGSSLRPRAQAQAADLEGTGQRRFASSPFFQQALSLLS